MAPYVLPSIDHRLHVATGGHATTPSISANNVLPATILEIRERTGSHVDVRLLCGTTMLVAWITRASRERLQLTPGAQVFAIIKSVSIVPQARLAD